MSDSSDEQNIGREVEELLLRTYPRRLHFCLKFPLIGGLIYILVASATFIIVTKVFGGFSETADVLDFTEDISSIYAIFAIGAAIYYWLLLPSLLKRTFGKLSDNEVFASEVQISPKFQNSFASLWVRRLPYIFAVGADGLIASGLLDNSTYWHEVHPISFVCAILIWLFAFFAAASAFLNIVIAIVLIDHIFRHNPTVTRPLHPDRAGGFRPLGDFSLRLSYLAVIYGLFYVTLAIRSTRMGTIGEDYSLFFWVTFYFIIVPILFYLPLDAAHRAMVAYRDNLIRDTSARYSKENQGIHETDYTLDADELEQRLRALDALKKLQEQHEREYPVWPFNMRIRITVLANAMVPVIPTLIGLIIDTLS
jgi:hypothetical protein